MDLSEKTPSMFQILTDRSLEGIQKQIKNIRAVHESLNKDSEIIIDVNPDPNTVSFDGYSERKLNMALYIIYKQDN